MSEENLESPVEWVSDERWIWLSKQDKSMIRNGATEAQMNFRWAEEMYTATLQYASGDYDRHRTMLDSEYKHVCETYKIWEPESTHIPQKYH